MGRIIWNLTKLNKWIRKVMQTYSWKLITRSGNHGKTVQIKRFKIKNEQLQISTSNIGSNIFIFM